MGEEVALDGLDAGDEGGDGLADGGITLLGEGVALGFGGGERFHAGLEVLEAGLVGLHREAAGGGALELGLEVGHVGRAVREELLGGGGGEALAERALGVGLLGDLRRGGGGGGGRREIGRRIRRG